MVQVKQNYFLVILKIVLISWLCQYFNFLLKKKKNCGLYSSLSKCQKVTIDAFFATLTAKQTELPFAFEGPAVY